MIIDNQTSITVSELNHRAKRLLESQFDQVRVEGEISNLTIASSGHWYFTLKDDAAQVSCAMFAGANRKVKPVPEQGDKVVVEADVSLYAARGSFQLIVQSLQPAGLGQWQIAFAELQRKLAAEGLFDPERKQSLPRLPKCLGIVSSLKGAVVHDIIRTVRRRYDLLPIRIYPSSVQGQQAVDELVAAIALAIEDDHCDVLIIARGGGSIEDLWSFNNEQVARAIASCPLVTVSAVGHENDFTIADFVADLRASTPTAAAEQVTPEKSELQRIIDDVAFSMTDRVGAIIDTARMSIEHLAARLVHPGVALELRQEQLDRLATRLHSSIETLIESKSNALDLMATRLIALDHRKPLQRGYVLASTPEGKPLTSVALARQAERINLGFHDGELEVIHADSKRNND